MRILAESIILLLSAASALMCEAADFPPSQSDATFTARSGHCITNVAQFRTLSSVEFLAGCGFQLTGVVTLVDTDRDLVVLQDATGAVALNFRTEGQNPQVGQFVALDGTNCCPYFASFPDYPYYPSGWNICSSFEAPMNWGEYNLTRMRGYLHPQVTGEYRFWVASDNSSELWLSTDADPSEIRKIASVPRFGYVNPYEWSRYPSQSSEPIELKAGKTYYIEALQEQTTGGENLSVGWQGPGLHRSVIDGHYLTPWNEDGRPGDVATNGILREYWTNYSAGDLIGMGGARPFESVLTVEKAWMHGHGQGKLPKPDPIVLNRPLRVENNYRWVRAEGVVKFKAADGNSARLELSDGRALVEVRVQHWSPEMSKQLRQLSNAVVRIEGVCEGVYDQNETMIPGLIWASAENSISFVETATTNSITLTGNQSGASTTTTNPARQGFYQIRGVVTFNDRALGTDYIFVQAADATAVRVTLDDPGLKSHLKAGEWADLGGRLEPGKYLPVITPLYVTELGRHSMPSPITQSLGTPATANPEGDWREIEGVVHSVNTNGTLSIAGIDGPAYLWLGQTSSNSLARYVDAKLRARGVLMLHLLDAPVLLIPSRDFVDVEEEAPKDPFGIRGRFIADLLSESMESSRSQRVRVVGEVTYRDAGSFFVQDPSGGIRVRTADEPTVITGETIEVVAFPTLSGSVRLLTEALVRPTKSIEHVGSKDLNLSEALSSKQSGTLVHVIATLLGQSTNESGQVLELQELQRVFVASLANGQGNMPDIAPGSRLQITGVCDNETTTEFQPGGKPASAQMLASLNILLRSPSDVTVISGPPWWTWKRTVTLVGTLLIVLLVTLLWVHLLRRRLERQQASQLAFSRHVLERLEDERRRIAINLHDSLGQVMLAIKNQALLAIQRPLDEAGLRRRLEEISGASSQAIEEVRQITYGLRPYQLDRLGLTQAIRAAVGLADESGSILFAIRVEGIDNVFDKDSEIHFYRIVQEAINNVVKHSAATEATVVIKRRPGVVSLSVRDNGRGFAMGGPGSTNPSSIGSGLSGIAERVRILNGTLVVDSRPGEGTNLTIEVILPTDTNEAGSNSIHRG